MNWIDRRAFVASIAGAGLASASCAQTGAPPRFAFDDVVRRARDLSTAPLAPPPPLPDALLKLDPGATREIRFRPERAMLAGQQSLFRLQAAHVTPRSHPVTVNIIRDGIPTPIPYAANLFDFGAVKFERPLPLNLGFAGFRLQFPLNDPREFDDAIVFSGANRFTLLGRGQRPGARLGALTVNAGKESEESPFFREFWIETPAPNAPKATIYALLDGDSVTGAFRFEISPGVESRLDVTATLFPRRVGGVLGLAPITSTFVSGAGKPGSPGDFRPSAHSSDGLQLRTGAGEWLWRPLRNPEKQGSFAFLDRNPAGFGLIQRDRNFDHYQDLDAAFEQRPNYWVEPSGDWGEGHVELVEAPATDETASNISAAWTPSEQRDPGKPIEYAYSVFACQETRRLSRTGRAMSFLEASLPPATDGATARRFLIDFAGGDLAYYLDDPGKVEIVATIANGRLARTLLQPNAHVDGFRASVDAEVGPGEIADMRVALRAGGRKLTETWTFPARG